MLRRGRRPQGITSDSLESRIALSVANDSDPLSGLPAVVSPPALTHHAKAVVAAPTVSASSASLAQSAERITLHGTGFDRRPGHNLVAFDGGVTGKVVSATPTTMVGKAAITASTQRIHRGDRTIEIRDSNFSTVAADNKVTFNLGAVGVVTSATRNRLVVTFTTLPSPGKLTAMVTAKGGSSGQSAPVATVESASYSLVSQLVYGEYDETFQYSSVGIAAGDHVIFTVTDSGDDEVDEVAGTTYDTSGAVITGVWSAPVDSSNLQTFTITALQDSYGLTCPP